MPLSVTTDAESKKLTTLDSVKDALGITGSDDDTLINTMIDSASRRIASFCGREFARQVLSETMPGYGDNTLMLSQTPVVTLTSVAYQGTTIDSGNYELSNRDTGEIFNDYGFQDTAKHIRGVGDIPDPASRKNDYTVVYTAGYYLPSFSEGGSGVAPTDPGLILPVDIQLAATELAKSIYLGRNRDQSVKQEAATNVGSVTYHGGSSASEQHGGLPPFVAELLLPYRRALI